MPLARTRDVCLSYQVEGEGAPVLLIAGTGSAGAEWRVGPSARLAAAGFKAISYDHRGIGESDKPDIPYSTHMFADDAVGLLDALGIEKAHLMGHSMGGRVAQWIALDHPERVRSLVLLATGAGTVNPDKPQEKGIPLQTAVEMIELGYEKYSYDHIASPFFFTPPFVREHPEVVKALADAFWSDRPPLKLYLRHVIARQSHQTAERIHEITAPALVVVGEVDSSVAGTGSHMAQSEYLARHIAGAEFAVVPGAAHAFFWEKPEDTLKIVVPFMRKH